MPLGSIVRIPSQLFYKYSENKQLLQKLLKVSYEFLQTNILPTVSYQKCPTVLVKEKTPLSRTTKLAKIEDDLVMLTTKVHKDKLVLLMYTFC